MSDVRNSEKSSGQIFEAYKNITALVFTVLFQVIALSLVVIACLEFVNFPDERGLWIEHFVKVINTLIVALAIYELGIGVAEEYITDGEREHILSRVRRTVARFVGTVVIALVLEALIMVIKYSQISMAGNLVYPVWIIAACALLLAALGVYLRMTERYAGKMASEHAPDNAIADQHK